MGRPKTWRDDAVPIIAKVLKEKEGCTEREIRKALREAYPFGQREYHPYKIWCDEIRRQRGLKRTREQKLLDEQPKLF
jgi:hypothetical protein